MMHSANLLPFFLAFSGCALDRLKEKTRSSESQSITPTTAANESSTDDSALKISETLFQIHVSAAAPAGGNGTPTAPLSTLEDAMLKQRQIRKTFKDAQVEVLLNEGRYEISDPLYFDAEDSGPSPDRPTIWRSAKPDGMKPVITAGQKLTQKPTKIHTTAAGKNVYSVPTDGLVFSNVYFGRNQGIRARIPNQDSALPELTKQSFESYPATPALKVPSTGWQAWAVDYSASCGGNLMQETEIVLNKTWAPARHKIVSITREQDGNDKIVISDKFAELELCLSTTVAAAACNLSSNTYFGPYYHYDDNWQQHQPYYFENNPCFVDESGEWHANFNSKVMTFIPPNGFDPMNDSIYVPRSNVEKLLSIGSRDSKATNIAFKNIEFSTTNWMSPLNNGTYVWAGNSYISKLDQSRTPVVEFMPSAITLSNSENITFEDNKFVGFAAAGIGIDKPVSKGITIERSEFEDIASSAISTLTYDVVFEDITVRNSTFRNIGKRFGGNGIQISSAKNVIIEHNDLKFISSVGITLSGVKAGSNRISKNRLEQAPTDYGDSGAIYTNTTGSPEENLKESGTGNFHISVTENVIDSVLPAQFFTNPTQIKSSRPSGIYLDFYSFGVSVSRNIIRNVPFGFRLNCARNNAISQNHTMNLSHHLFESGCAGMTASMQTLVSDQVADSGASLNGPNALSTAEIARIEAEAGPTQAGRVVQDVPSKQPPLKVLTRDQDSPRTVDSQANSKCTIIVTECFANRKLIGTFVENNSGAELDQNKCLKMAAEYANRCKINPQVKFIKRPNVTARYSENNKDIASKSAYANGCLIEANVCENGVTGSFSKQKYFDNYQNSGSDKERCRLRAQEYHVWCENKPGDQFTSSLILDGDIKIQGRSR